MAVALDAKAVIIENVQGLERDVTQVLDTTISLLASEGYSVSKGVLKGDKLGLAQTRSRLFLIAVKGNRIPDIKAVSKALGKPVRNIRWAIEDLQETIPFTDNFNAPANLNLENIQRIEILQTSGEFDMPNNLRPPSHKNGNTYPAVYGRLDWEKPSGTITTGYMTPGRGRFTHPSRPSAITAHEAARLQGFPDTYEFLKKRTEGDFVPTRRELSTAIGDAVPPLLGYVAGLAALQTMFPNND
tara:strand:- start:125 stop:853 length:729 start_codon:yes stop_codon:yes gene_type:complete